MGGGFGSGSGGGMEAIERSSDRSDRGSSDFERPSDRGFRAIERSSQNNLNPWVV